jgi:hypothetical protein
MYTCISASPKFAEPLSVPVGRLVNELDVRTVRNVHGLLYASNAIPCVPSILHIYLALTTRIVILKYYALHYYYNYYC